MTADSIDRLTKQVERLGLEAVWTVVLDRCEAQFGPAEPDGDDPQDSPANPGFEVTDGDVDDYFETLAPEQQQIVLDDLEGRPDK